MFFSLGTLALAFILNGIVGFETIFVVALVVFLANSLLDFWFCYEAYTSKPGA